MLRRRVPPPEGPPPGADETAVMRGGPTPPPLGEPVPPPGVVVEEGPPPRRRAPFPPDRDLWPWLLLLLLLALAGIGVGLWLSTRDNDHKKASSTTAAASTVVVTQTTPTRPAAAVVAVPKVVGLTRAAAVQQLRSFGFKPAVQQQASSKPAGTVLGQNPASGARVTRGATVIVAVARPSTPATTSATTTAAAPTTTAPATTTAQATPTTTAPATTTAQATTAPATATTAPATTTAPTTTAPATATVPNVVGQQRADAQASLRSAGLVTEVKGVPSAKPEGTVVSQAPKAGATLQRGGHVLINVANGRQPGEGAGAPTTVPNVVGKTRAEAQQAIRQAGLVTEVKGVPSNESEGTVVAQDPAGGASAKRGAHVLVNVANGQAPQ